MGDGHDKKNPVADVFVTIEGAPMIHHRFRKLSLALDLALRKPPSNLARGLKSLPAVGSLPSPWETRALLAVLEYRRTVLRIWDLVVENGLLSAGPDVPAAGYVPDAPDLHYNTNEHRCELIDQATGVYHYVHDWQSEPFLSWVDFTSFVRVHEQQPGCPAPILSLSQVEPSLDYELCDDYPWPTPTQVWDREMPDEGMMLITARDLEDAGVIVGTWVMPYCIPGLLIADEVLAMEEAIRSVYSGTTDPRDRLWRMACVGDWLGADAAALELGKSSLAKLTQERDALCREGRLGRIHARIDMDGGLTPRSLVALDDLGPEHSAAHIAKALSPGHRAARTALRIVTRRDDPAWFDAVRKLRLRLGCVAQSHVDADLVKACEAYIARGPARPVLTVCHQSEASQPWSRAGRAIEMD